jgi:hypothetical protein
MKKVILLLVLAILLTSCDQLPKIQPTITDQEMQTKVARILTSYPTSTPGGPASPASPQTTPDIVQTQEAIDLATNAPLASQSAAPVSSEAAQGGLPTNTPPISIPTLAPTETLMPTVAITSTPETTSTISVASVAVTYPGTDPVLKLATPTWQDTMDKSDNWPTSSNEFTTVDFRDGFMAFTGLKKDNGWRLSVNEIENFYMEMTARPSDCKGTDRYGLMLRVPDRKEANRGYWFQFSCEGKYAFQKWDGTENPGKVTGLIGWTSNAAINAGPNATNRLGIMAVGDTFTLYANGVKLATVSDDTWLKGGFGVIIGAKETTGFTVYIDQIRYWLNPAQ